MVLCFYGRLLLGSRQLIKEEPRGAELESPGFESILQHLPDGGLDYSII